MALGRNGNIIIVRNNGNHTINDLYNANTSRVRRQGVMTIQLLRSTSIMGH